MTEQDPPKIEFPCDYPIKVIGEATLSVEHVVEIALRHDPELDSDAVTRRPSSNGNYHSITLQFRATGEVQLKRLFEELKACDAVKMVL